MVLNCRRDIDELDTWPMLCEADICTVMHGGRTLYCDNNHITNKGTRALRGVFDPLLSN